MLFNSFDFGLFLPIVFILYWFLGSKKIKEQNILLLIASYFFYGIWDWRFLILIFLSSIVDYVAGQKIGISTKKSTRKLWLYLSIFWNIGILFSFKYFNFFLENLKLLFEIPESEFSTLNIIVPVGLSFYTFQTMSYTIDVYRNNLKPTSNLLQFLCFVSFFPQLVAGPIERASKLLPQFNNPRKFDYNKSKDGLRQILWGLFKKIVVADNLGIAVNAIFGMHESYASITLVYGSLLFLFQLYADFSGYADIAIGTARIFGFNLSVNFKLPYLAVSVTSFWRRWHLTLTKWFQDYVFKPLVRFGLQKNMNSLFIKIGATFTTMILIGLWHGANWSFVIFGIFHAVLLLFESIKIKHTAYKDIHTLLAGYPKIALLYSIPMLTLSLLFFRAVDLAQAINMTAQIFSPNYAFLGLNTIIGWKLGALLLMIAVELLQKKRLHGLENIETYLPKPIRWLGYYILIFAIIRYGGPQEQFIYFQF